MMKYQEQQTISQLEKRKGGYFYLTILSSVVDMFEHKRHTRFICTLDNKIKFQCGLNHLGDGNFFIILSAEKLKPLHKNVGNSILFELEEDPNPLGVDMPEVLEAVIEQDEYLKNKFEKLTMGKKRNVIHQINKIKDVDRQITKTIQLINDADKPRPKRLE